MKYDYDIVIVGAGMAGATLAAMLTPLDLKVLLTDVEAPVPFTGGDTGVRVSALGRASARILDAAGAWSSIVAARAAPYRAMKVWDSGSSGELSFDAADAALTELGWIVENQLVQHALLERTAQSRTVRTAWRTDIEAAEFADDAVLVKTGGRVVRCALLVGADGANSQVRELAGIGAHAKGYGQRAVVAVVTTALPHQDTAWQRFLDRGPVALLPLPNGRCSLVWSLPDADAARVLVLDEAAFCAELSAAIEHRLGPVTAAGPRAAFPLSRMHADEYVAPRCALIGDAAHVVHPLAGQGANLGLLDAAALAESLQDAVRAGATPGAWHALRRYARWRRAHNAVMQEMLDAFHRVFMSTNPLLRSLRGAGLNAVNRLGPVKTQMVRYATGEQGDLPAAARPRAGFR
ncbi:MAG: UbiH/UbiF/VisC/COQ6 family ubiquinone biosynthesis hydroxylase [Gammaproteobacteria bacterium]